MRQTSAAFSPSQLIDIAKVNNTRQRGMLLDALSTHFLDGHQNWSNKEIVLFGEICTLLLKYVELDARVRFAECMADQENAPRNLVFGLGKDVIEVARPVLMRSTNFETDGLCFIVKERTHEHRIAVTERKELPAILSSALICFGNIEIYGRLLTHANAELPSVIRAMLPFKNAQKKGDPATRVGNTAIRMAEDVTRRLQRSYSNLETELSRLATQGLEQVIWLVLSDLAKMKLSLVIATLGRGDPEALMTLVKAAGGKFDAFRQILMMQARGNKAQLASIDAMKKDFEKIDVENANRIIQFANFHEGTQLDGQ